MKNILIFSWFYLPYIGGAELFVREIVSRLSSRYRFFIVTARRDRALARRHEDSGAVVLRVGFGGSIDKFIYPLPALVRALGLKDISLIHAIMVNASAVAAYTYRLLTHSPSILTLQSGDTEEYVRGHLGLLFPVYPRLHRSFDRVHAISHHLREQAIGYGAAPDRIVTIPNGVDTDRFSREAHSWQELEGLKKQFGLMGKRILVSTSRMCLKNGLSDLLKAMPSISERHPDVVLLLVGDGEERPRLEGLARELRVMDRVRFLGSMDNQEVVKFVCLGEVFVRPSVSEGLGTAFLEALSCEVPVIGTPVGGIPDFLIPESTGLFCEPENPASIASSVARLLSSPTLARDCAVRGRAMVKRDYRWDTVAERIGALYDELLTQVRDSSNPNRK